MEENQRKRIINEQQQLITVMKQQLTNLTLQEYKKGQILARTTDQYIRKEKVTNVFDKDRFLKNSMNSNDDVQSFLERITVKLATIPFLQKIVHILESVNSQLRKILNFTIQKWYLEYKFLQQSLKKAEANFTLKTQYCQRCAQSIHHQHIKQQQNQILNLKVSDPYYYYKEVIVNKDQVSGQEQCYRKMQQKFTELENGLEMEQKFLNQLLENMNRQARTVGDNTPADNSGELINLPLMPMLRSVFNYIKTNKKQATEIGIQTIKMRVITTTQQCDQNLAEYQKQNTSFLIHQISEKTTKIKGLEEKIVEVQNINTNLKILHEVLITENNSLYDKNTILEAQLKNTEHIKNNSKLKAIMNIKKKDTIKDRELSILNNNIQVQKQNSNLKYAQSASASKPTSKQDNKMRNTIFIKKKTSLMPNILPNSLGVGVKDNLKSIRNDVNGKYKRQSNLRHMSSTISLQKSIDRIQQDLQNSLVDLPSISLKPSFQSMKSVNLLTEQIKITETQSNTFAQNQPKVKNLNIINDKYKFKSSLNSDFTYQNEKSIASQNEPITEFDLMKFIRRKGKFQVRDTLLKMLFDHEIKEKKHPGLDYVQFKLKYESCVIGKETAEQISKNYKLNSRQRNLQKKSTASMRQTLRNQVYKNESNSYEHQNIQEQSFSQSESQRVILQNLMQSLFIENTTKNNSSELSYSQNQQKKILSKGELMIMTEILAYMAQLKISNSQAYKLIHKIIAQKNKSMTTTMKDSSFFEDPRLEKKELKQKLSYIIKMHNKCEKIEDGTKIYCQHLKDFIASITRMLEN